MIPMRNKNNIVIGSLMKFFHLVRNNIYRVVGRMSPD